MSKIVSISETLVLEGCPPLCLLEDSGVLGGGLGVQQGVLGDVLGAPQVLDVDGVQQGVLGDVLGAPQVLDVDGGEVHDVDGGQVLDVGPQLVVHVDGAEKAPTNHLSTSFYPEAEEVEPPQPSASESKDEDTSPPKKKLRKALNDARTDSKVSFQ